MRVHTLQIHALIITVFRGLSHERRRETNLSHVLIAIIIASTAYLILFSLIFLT